METKLFRFSIVYDSVEPELFCVEFASCPDSLLCLVRKILLYFGDKPVRTFHVVSVDKPDPSCALTHPSNFDLLNYLLVH